MLEADPPLITDWPNRRKTDLLITNQLSPVESFEILRISEVKVADGCGSLHRDATQTQPERPTKLAPLVVAGSAGSTRKSGATSTEDGGRHRWALSHWSAD
jgi:hypothetical protein